VAAGVTGRGGSGAPGRAAGGELVRRAHAFARALHAGHVRQGQAGRPYLSHLEEVVSLLQDAGADDATLAAGWLHDAAENTLTAARRITARDLADQFGWAVAAMVAEVTENPRIPLPLRRDLRIRSARFATPGAQMLTLADLVSLLRGLLEDPPPDWEHARKVEFLGWAGRVAAACRDASPRLAEAFDRAYREGLAGLAREA